MFFNQIKFLFRDALFYVASHISPYLVNPDKNFTRRRKLPSEMLMSFLISQGASTAPTSMHSMTLIPIRIRMHSSSLSTARTNSELSALWWARYCLTSSMDIAFIGSVFLASHHLSGIMYLIGSEAKSIYAAPYSLIVSNTELFAVLSAHNSFSPPS